MKRPINVFFDLLKHLKDLIVSVKIGDAKATLFGEIVKQITPDTFEVKDEIGNKGICRLVNKEVDNLHNDEMSVKGYNSSTMSFAFISKIIYDVVEDFKGMTYNWYIENDSTSSILLLKRQEV